MKQMRGILLPVLMATSPITARSQPPTDVVLDTIAKAFQYPREQLRLKDLSNSEDAKQNPRIRAGYLIESEGDIFAYAQVIAADEGTCLTPEIRQRFETAIQEQAAVTTGQTNMRRINGPDGITGYVGPGGLGPGGAAIRAVMHIPAQRLDWQITIYQIFEPEKTQENLSNSRKPDFIVSALEASVQELAARAAAGIFSLGESAPPQQQPTTALAIAQSSPIPAAETPLPDSTKGSSASTPAGEANRNPGKGVGLWVYVLIVAVAIAGATLWWRRRRI